MTRAFAALRPQLLSPEEVAARIPPGHRRAAVSVTLRWHQGRPEVLLMLRSEHEDDRWSGQVSLPGGHAERADADLVATVVRETVEEVGLDLGLDGELLGALEPLQARADGGLLGTTIAPLVFGLDRERELALGPEAVEAFWLPLDRVASGELDDVFRHPGPEGVIELPCWRFDGRTVWGLTRAILAGLLQRAGEALRGPAR